ncbi:hypothetical protein Tco_0984054 [Tanacetum coccineum]
MNSRYGGNFPIQCLEMPKKSSRASSKVVSNTKQGPLFPKTVSKLALLPYAVSSDVAELKDMVRCIESR